MAGGFSLGIRPELACRADALHDLRINEHSLFRFLNSFDNYALPRLYSFFDKPHRAQLRSHLHWNQVRFILAIQHGDLIPALHFVDRSLRQEHYVCF